MNSTRNVLENEIKKGEKVFAELKISLNDEFINLKNKINLVESTQTEEQKRLLIKIKGWFFSVTSHTL